jgi:hypothetical protein
MARLFPPWADTGFRVALVLIFSTAASALVAPMVYVRSPYGQNREFPVEQPVQFDHRHHVKDDHIDCLYCHGGAARSAYAGIPPAELCMGCHNQVWPASALLAPVRDSYFSGRPLQWNRVHRVPDFVYFNHAVHVNGGVGCVRCHGRVEEMALDYQVAPLSMGWCLDCHRESAAKLARAPGVQSLTNCSTCHR